MFLLLRTLTFFQEETFQSQGLTLETHIGDRHQSSMEEQIFQS